MSLRSRSTSIANRHPDHPSLDEHLPRLEVGGARQGSMAADVDDAPSRGSSAFLVLALALIRGVHPDQLMAGMGVLPGRGGRRTVPPVASRFRGVPGHRRLRPRGRQGLPDTAVRDGGDHRCRPHGIARGIVARRHPQVRTQDPRRSPKRGIHRTETALDGDRVRVPPEYDGDGFARDDRRREPVGGSRSRHNRRPSTLSNAFSLATYPLGLVIALAFGLTPNLVLQRLGVSASEAKEELLATRPT